MRREKGVNKSHTGLHLLLENSKQKQAFSSRTKGSVLPGCSFSILLFSLQSGGKRGSRHLSSSLQCGRSSKLGCFSLGVPNFWGCVAEVTPALRGSQPQAWSPLKEGNSASFTIYRAFKQLLCVSPSPWQFQESLRSPPSPTGMQGCFMSHSSSTPFWPGDLSTCRELSASPTASKDNGNSTATRSSWAFPVAHPTCRTQSGRIRVEGELKGRHLWVQESCCQQGKNLGKYSLERGAAGLNLRWCHHQTGEWETILT